MSLRSSSQQPPVTYVKCDRLQPRIEPLTEDLSPARGTARPCRCLQYKEVTKFVYRLQKFCGKTAPIVHNSNDRVVRASASGA